MSKQFKPLILIALSINLASSIYADDKKLLGGRTDSGGNLLENNLEQSLELLRKTLKKFKKENYNRALVDKYCPKEWMYPSSDPKKPGAFNLCTDFLVETAQEMLEIIGEKPIPELQAIVPDDPSEFTFTSTLGEGSQQFDAHTSSTHDSPIIYNYRAIRKYSIKDLTVITYHELGHKVKFRGRKLGYYDSVDGLGTSRDLMNAAGVAIYLYGESNKIFQPEKRKELSPAKKDHFNCEIIDTADDNKTIHRFVTKQLKKHFKEKKAYETGIGISKSFGYEITDITNKYFPGERIYFSLRIHEGALCEGESDDKRSIFMYLVSRVPKEKDFVKIEPYPPSSFCDCKETKYEISYQNLRVSCVYDGFYLD